MQNSKGLRVAQAHKWAIPKSKPFYTASLRKIIFGRTWYFMNLRRMDSIFRADVILLSRQFPVPQIT